MSYAYKFNPSLLSKHEIEENRKALKEMLKKDGNRACADCGAPRPTWASANLGVFICQKCAGHHRAMGSVSRLTKTVKSYAHNESLVQQMHDVTEFVRSISLDSWSKDQVEFLSCLDNLLTATYWEHNLPSDFKRPRLDSLLREFVRNKYDFKKFIDKSMTPPTIDKIKDHPWFEDIQKPDEPEEPVVTQPLTNPKGEMPKKDGDNKIKIGGQNQRAGSTSGIKPPPGKQQETQDLLTVETPMAPKPEYDKNDPLAQIDGDQTYQMYQQIAVPQIGYDPNWRENQNADGSTVDPTKEDEEGGAQRPAPGTVPQIAYLPKPPKKEDPFEKSNMYSQQQTSLNPQSYLSGQFSQPAGAPTPFNTPVVSQNTNLNSNATSLHSNISTLNNNLQMPMPGQKQEVLMIEAKKEKDVEMFEASVKNLADSSYLVNSGLVGVKQKPINESKAPSMKEMRQHAQMQQMMMQQQWMQQNIEETRNMYSNIDLNEIKAFNQQMQFPQAQQQAQNTTPPPQEEGQPKISPLQPPPGHKFFQGVQQGGQVPFKYFQNGNSQSQVQNGSQKTPQIYNPMANDGLGSINPVNQPKPPMRNGMSTS